jgi:hypothetical protein
MANAPCIICGFSAAQPAPRNLGDWTEHNCPRCGHFFLSGSAEATLGNLIRDEKYRWAITSHAVRNMQSPNGPPPRIKEPQLKSIWTQVRLPNPAEQAERFIKFLGDSDLPPGEFLPVSIEHLMATLGTTDHGQDGKQRGFQFIMNRLKEDRLIETPQHPENDGKARFRLSYDGWVRYHELHRGVTGSRTAFMAMGYSSPDIMQAFEKCFVPAANAAGFELKRLDQKPRAGLIDLRMRVDIRTARFVVADLTDENRGAYWEAGFAEGLGKHVFYTCEASKFNGAKTHFDTEHLLTIKWTLEDLSKAEDELKAAIRNTLPIDAKLSD